MTLNVIFPVPIVNAPRIFKIEAFALLTLAKLMVPAPVKAKLFTVSEPRVVRLDSSPAVIEPPALTVIPLSIVPLPAKVPDDPTVILDVAIGAVELIRSVPLETVVVPW